MTNTLTKSRAHKPLVADGRLSLSSSRMAGVPSFNLSLHDSDLPNYFTMTLDNASAQSVATLVAGALTFDYKSGMIDRRTSAEKLRALADMWEANLKAMREHV